MIKRKIAPQKSIRLSAVLAVCISLASCQAGDEPQPEEETPAPVTERRDIPLTKAEGTIVQGNNAFAFGLLQAVASEEEKDNLFISPLSATLALGMLNNGAAGSTSEEIRSVLGYAGIPTEEINDYFLKMLTALKDIDPDVTLESANSIWIRNDFQALPSFVEVNQSRYGAGVYHEDFADPATLGRINAWCSDKTHGMIEQILDNISGAAVMYLLNGLYFKGMWTVPFDREQTGDATFAGEGAASSVPMMQKVLQLNYARNDLFEIAEAPYGNEAFSTLFVLPAEGAALPSVIESLNASAWNGCLAKLSPQTVRLGIPRMKLAYGIDLIPALKKLGMQSMFDAGKADFSGIHPTAPLVVSLVKQKTALEINEEGSEAAAATVVGMEMLAPSPDIAPVSFILNRPFLLFIKEKSTGAILFEGLVRKL
jgi:serpin B